MFPSSNRFEIAERDATRRVRIAHAVETARCAVRTLRISVVRLI